MPGRERNPGLLATPLHTGRTGAAEEPDDQLVMGAPHEAVALAIGQPMKRQRRRCPLGRRHEAMAGRVWRFDDQPAPATFRFAHAGHQPAVRVVPGGAAVEHNGA